MKRVLIVGGGAVGQVYGWFLKQGGAEVSYYLKPRHAEAAREGFTLYWLNRDRKKSSPIRWRNFELLTRVEDVAARDWDLIVLAVSSDALRSGWLEGFSPAVSRARAVLMLQPDLRDREFLLKYFDEARLISGMISLAAYQTPLPGEEVTAPGTAFFLAPGASPLAGPRERAEEVARLLSGGGLRSRVRRSSVLLRAAFESAALIVLVTALEGADWSWRRVREAPERKRLWRAIGEVCAVISQELGIPLPLWLRFAGPGSMGLALALVPRLAPFDLEKFFRAHFTKVAAQTRLMMANYLEMGRKHGLSVQALEELESRVDRA